ncbi:50S ribosomal protein L24 [Parafannyhessea umbonata]|uniref:Large ribosomal subunit protein uL24 n=1 Tax=Parafannyhessea umbonata TaxID=604330 RepID=A0A1G6JEV0_9ACTN|nr:50S ribosomal protein L24 [Parafannyhessea umbonata]SDC17177.1 LSU ribosomal protein L24P [Parafannyhessea umbonata]
MAKMNVKKGDQVEVLSGKDKGKRGEVIVALPSEGKVVVRGVAVVKKAQRPTQANQQGGIVEKEAAIDVSNVALVCPTCGKATRVGHAEEDGKKVRVCKKCGVKF